MTTTITAKGQITIPLRLRQRLHLNVGDQIEFDETAPVLTARRVVNRSEWEKAFGEWRNAAEKSLEGHPWEKQPSSAIVDDLRGGKSEPQRKQRGK
jgi:AbrB family looped-hinge helix DNA binding protein